MKARLLEFQFILALAAALFLVTPSEALNNSSLKGGYSVLLTSAAGSTPTNMVGVLTFDGAGNANAAFQTNIDGTLGSATGSGTYSVSSNGTGSMSLLLSTGETIGYYLALQDGGKVLQLMVTSESGQSDVEVITGTALPQATTSPYTFTNGSLKGSYRMLMTKVPLDQSDGGPADMAGNLDFDGKGNVTFGAGTMNDNGVVNTFTAAGTYTTNANGAGTVTLNVSGGLVANFAFVLNGEGKALELIELTTNAGGRNDVIGGAASR